ncbi:lipopolysaccharide biosynthesis protein [Alkalicoccus halolimnae]|uniref:Oligosaccharide flippase family protein n=1 Tax=Alkalicoccus halolimnae TaxID=1667239 RepID=A0A5C7F8I3_9BACI|nr:oligosaccharide flippase family protein [Alkalicoccus halolimnae]TXF87021.1 oligosaccharide flippase family protein [Alkalicoccus halolimnae]
MKLNHFLNIRRSKFFKHSVLYTLGSMMTPLISLILLPVYTNYLSPSEYGTMTTVQTMVGMLQLFLLLALHGAITRFFFDFLEDKEKQKEYIGSIYLFVFIFSSFGSIVLFIFSDQIGSLIFSNIQINPYMFYLIGLSWATSLLALPMALFRAQEKVGIFVSFNIIKALIIMIFTSYLIIWRGLGAESALFSQFTITVLFLIVAFIIQRKDYKLSFSPTAIKTSLIFSMPLLPHVASGWIIKSSDRVILEKFVDLNELGFYALAAQVSMVLTLFYTSINNAVVPRYTKLRKQGKNESADKLLKYFLYIVIGFGIISIPIATLGVWIITSPEFYSALALIPVLIVGQILKGMYFIPVAKLFYTKKTNAIATSSTIAAVVNISINLIAIPYIGVYGAVTSTIVGEFIRLALIYRASRISSTQTAE